MLWAQLNRTCPRTLKSEPIITPDFSLIFITRLLANQITDKSLFITTLPRAPVFQGVLNIYNKHRKYRRIYGYLWLQIYLYFLYFYKVFLSKIAGQKTIICIYCNKFIKLVCPGKCPGLPRNWPRFLHNGAAIFLKVPRKI